MAFDVSQPFEHAGEEKRRELERVRGWDVVKRNGVADDFLEVI